MTPNEQWYQIAGFFFVIEGLKRTHYRQLKLAALLRAHYDLQELETATLRRLTENVQLS